MNAGDRAVVVYGGPGLGKTSIMASLADRCARLNGKNEKVNREAVKVFCHFTGAVTNSTDLLTMLTRLLLELDVVSQKEKPSKLEDAMALVRGALANPKTVRSVIIIDAVNQFDAIQGIDAPVTWIPRELSNSISIFVSVTPESPQYQALAKNAKDYVFEELKPLDEQTRRDIVVSHLERYNKKLDTNQLNMLLEKSCAENPMWLSLAAEELRVYGNFRKLNEKIKQIPDGLADMEACVLNRFEQETDGSKLIATLCLLECSRTGLLESELLQLLANENLLPKSMSSAISKISSNSFPSRERITASEWSEIFRVLKPFVRPFGSSGEGRLNFYHRSLSIAVRIRYFGCVNGDDLSHEKSETALSFHKHLLDFFGEKNRNVERRVEEYPLHAFRCGDFEGLKRFLTNWNIFERLYDDIYSRELIRYWEYCHIISPKMSDSSDRTSVYQVMEVEYFKALANEKDSKLNYERRKKLSKIFAETGLFDSAHKLAVEAISTEFPSFKFPQYDKQMPPTPVDIRKYFEIASNIPAKKLLELAKVVYLVANSIDKKVRQFDYQYRSQLPIMCEATEAFEITCHLLKQNSPKDPFLGRVLNRLSFYYTGIAGRGGTEVLTTQLCKQLRDKAIEEAIVIFKSIKGSEIDLADCFITKGVASDGEEQLTYYKKGLEMIIQTSGRFHPLLGRTYLNVLKYFFRFTLYPLFL